MDDKISPRPSLQRQGDVQCWGQWLCPSDEQKTFFRSPGDLTLAAHRLTGIVSFSKSVGARMRWIVARSMRSELVRLLIEKSGPKKKADVVQELTQSRIKRGNVELNKISTSIRVYSVPFSYR